MATKRELENICARLQELDIQLHDLFARKEELVKDLTQEEKNKLHGMVMADGKSHFC